MLPPQGSNLQSSGSKSDMLAITPEGNLSKFFTKLSLSDTLLESLLLHKVPKFGTYCILYLFGYKKAKFDSFIPVRVYLWSSQGSNLHEVILFFWNTCYYLQPLQRLCLPFPPENHLLSRQESNLQSTDSESGMLTITPRDSIPYFGVFLLPNSAFLSQIVAIFTTKFSKNILTLRGLQGFFCRPPLGC